MMTPEQKKLIKNLQDTGLEPWLGRANWIEFAEIYGATPETWRQRYRRIKRRFGENFIPTETAPVKNDTTTLFEQIVTNAGLDPAQYYLEEGKIWGHPNSPQISAKLQIRPEVIDWDSIANRLAQPSYQPEGQSLGNWLATINLYDLHLWKQDIGGNSMDKQRNLINGVLNLLMRRLAAYKHNITRVLLPLGNDFLNFDNVNLSTTAGTPQENVGNWKAGIDFAVEMAISVVKTISQHYPASVLMIEGNHDRFGNHLLGHVLRQAFGQVDHVEIRSTPTGRHYYRHYDCGLMFAHGDKRIDWQTLWATESPTTFVAPFKEVHLGHLHTQAQKEVGGVLVRHHGSLAPTGQWELDNGYVGNRRQGSITVYSDRGRISDIYADSTEIL